MHPAGEADSDIPRLCSTGVSSWNFTAPASPPMRGCSLIANWTTHIGLTTLAGAMQSDARRGKNARHLLTGLLRQSVFGRLAKYEDVNDGPSVWRAILRCAGLLVVTQPPGKPHPQVRSDASRRNGWFVMTISLRSPICVVDESTVFIAAACPKSSC